MTSILKEFESNAKLLTESKESWKALLVRNPGCNTGKGEDVGGEKLESTPRPHPGIFIGAELPSTGNNNNKIYHWHIKTIFH